MARVNDIAPADMSAEQKAVAEFGYFSAVGLTVVAYDIKARQSGDVA
jgi:hypothetical protein